MVKAYINYPNPKISIHNNLSCSQIMKQNKANQRIIKIDVNSISNELKNFINRTYTFGSTPDDNDMWLEIDFEDILFEMNLLEYIRKIIAKHYMPFNGINIQVHC